MDTPIPKPPTKIVLFAWLMSLGCLDCWSAAFPGSYAAVTLSNGDVNHPIYYGTTGNPAAGADFYVEILGGLDANNLEPVTDLTGMHNSIFNIGAGENPPGFFDGAWGSCRECPKGLHEFNIRPVLRKTESSDAERVAACASAVEI